ncbi:hypothetical protein N7532_010975 [Penicillium argentinense]|uniref:Metallo-beta-lactamase domain-containing protein n=1 Tax=Penicillium argentinense TaxID=1131581 RepID=A0A9W9JY46_9EURO|nr:uncharacterized protein N7532_010975 [Penicillium argentinense]KAJ5086204.1 hypothetical protein N7532_010975 [Penicillium argentinense]
MSSFLQVDAYCAPAIPAETGYEEPVKQLWSSICCTLLQGPTSVVLVDTPTTAELTKGTFTPPTHMGIISSAIFLKDFPEAKSVATSFVVEGIKEALAEDNLAIWKAMFPGQLPEGQCLPEALPANGEFSIDGHSLFCIDVVFSDTENPSFLHVPSLDLVVSGDIVYRECFKHLGEANTPEKRKLWLDALDQIAALEPSIVVTGHKRVSQLDGPYLIDLTKEYIHAFEEEVKKWKDADKVEDAMKKRYPHIWNEFILSNSCKNTVARLMEAEKKSSN